MTLTRRQFTRFAATSAAVTLLPRAFAQAPRRIRYAAIGLGRISVGHFMPGCLATTNSQITGLVSGSPDKARKLAAQYNVPEASIYTYENFDRIKDDPNIDAVYIGLPNSMHAEYTIRAAKAGKHVLCEKPMATKVADAEAMIAACKQANRKLMIAYRCQLEPTTLHARQLIQSGALGKIQAIESANGFNIKAGEWRLNGKLAGGGPLMDMGVYSLNACRFLLGEEPTHIAAYSSVIDHDGRFDEVEENVAWSMKFPAGAVASCTTTYGANMDGFYRVYGSKGMLTAQPAFGYEGIHLTASIGKDPIEDLEQAKDPSQFAAEADHFSNCILEDRQPGPSGKEGLRDMKLMMQIYKSAASSA